MKFKDPIINIVLDTVGKKKQALVFVNTKRSAEKVAEDISKKFSLSPKGVGLSERILSSLSRPTKQCERLRGCVKKGIAFHHAGLHPSQKTLVEDAFREGTIKVICCTPTLAAGLDLPAFRAIIRDVKRFTHRGMTDIPVLEYLQMAGRAGRPKFDEWGEAILIASSDAERDAYIEKYVNGEPENIYSKLAVEPVLRTSVLSLISTRLVKDRKSMRDFFGQTLWAYQFKDLAKFNFILDRMVEQLTDWGFVDESFHATRLGRRVAELYIDPWTAHRLIVGLRRAAESETTHLSWTHLICCTLEMRPLLRVRVREYEDMQEKVASWSPYFLEKEPSAFEPEYDEWLAGVKTAWMLGEWMDERDEQWLLEKFGVRPGELRAKLDKCEWLLYSIIELARILEIKGPVREILRAKIRLQYGVREELLPLMKIKFVGRVRARKLFNAGLRDAGAVRKNFLKLATMFGKGVASRILKDLGVKENTQSRL